MMEENKTGTQQKKKQYEYADLPKNVRQIGVPLPGTKIFLEDYVITYLKQSFVNIDDSKIVILLGKKGTEDAQRSIFIYGAIALEEQDILENGNIQKETWDAVHEMIRQHFSGTQVFGCACGVGVWNSDMESKVRRLQKGEFATEDQVLFLWDLCEKEEKIFTWQRGMVKEQSGYYIYFEKNPQMQEYMLDKQTVKSIDAEYQDNVTTTMRQVIEEKEEEKQRKWQMISYCGAVAAGVAILFGIHMMIDSTARIKNMEKTVDALSEYVGKQQGVVETMAEQAENAVKQVSSEDQADGKAKNKKAGAGDTEDSKEEQADDQQAENGDGQTGTEEGQAGTGSAGQDGQNDSSTAADGQKAAGSEDGQTSLEEVDKQVASLGNGNDEDSSSVTGDEGGTTENNTQAGQSAQKDDSSSSSKKDLSEEMAIQAMKKNAQSYIVQKGDTLSQIVWRQYHDLSHKKQVKEINGIEDEDKIYAGQCILLPKFQ